MANDLVTALKSVLDRLGDLAASDSELQGRLLTLAQAFLALAEKPAPAQPTAPPSRAEPPLPPEPAPPPATPPVPSRPPEMPPPDLRHYPSAAELDLATVASRCQLKAEASRWVAARSRLPRDNGEATSRGDELLTLARQLPDCFLWMLHHDGPGSAAPAVYDSLAGCFAATATAVLLMNDLMASPPEAQETFKRAAELTAEAQSALRAAVAATSQRSDTDQTQLYGWLRWVTGERRLYLARFMRADDQADPARWPVLGERINRLAEEVREAKDRSRKGRKLFDKVRYHATRLAAGAGGANDWDRVIAVTDELVLTAGLPPSNKDLRDLLLPLFDTLPEGAPLPEGFRRVLREVDRYLASRPAEEEPSPEAEFTDDVRRATELLRGRAVVLIGGEGRPHAKQALERALGLSELIWLTGSHSSYTEFEPSVARPDVAVVLLAIRWSSHGFADVKEFCDQYGKPLVRLPAGYGPNQVAYHILSQTSGLLARAAVGGG